MVSTDKIERLRERLLVCPICMDEYKDPRLLPCHHTVCFECIGNIVRSSSNTGRLFRCPQCRTDIFVPRDGIESFPMSFYILSVQDEIGTKSYISSCDICEREWMQSQFKCIDCDLDICRFCIHEHRLCHHDSCRHGIIRIETVLPTSMNLSSNKMCSKHSDEILQIYCRTCDKAVCITCSCEEHKQHQTMPLSKKLREAQKQLQCELDCLTSQKKEADKLLEEIDKTVDEVKDSTREALDKVDERQKHLQKILDKMVAVKKQSLEKAERKNIDELNSFRVDLKSYFDQLDNGVLFLEELQEGDMCLELLDGFEKFQKVLSDQRNQLTRKRLTVNQMSFNNGTEYQLGLLDFVALTFGSLVAQKKNLSLSKSKESTAGTEKVKVRKFSARNLFICILFIFLQFCLSQLYYSYTDHPDTLNSILLCSVFLIYLCLAAYFA